jgi:hypothetical protein
VSIIAPMRKSSIAVLLMSCAACASAREGSEADAGDETDAAGLDPDAADPDAGEVDAPELDASPTDAATIDGAVVDAAIDAPPPPIDAPVDAMCSPTWHDILGNGGFDNAIAPWTQTSTIIRDAATMPFAPHNGLNAALFGASHNANDVLVQNLTIPATATALRLRGYNCYVTEDFLEDTDSFAVTLETPAGGLLETLHAVTNSDTLPFCAWQAFTWNATTPLAGQAIVLRFRGRTNLALYTRFAIDTLAFEWLGCP